MLSKKRIGRHLIGAVLVLVLGVITGSLFPEPARSQSTCHTQCMMDGSCSFTYNNWYCDFSGPGCITRDCETHELQCPPEGICQE